MATKGATKRLAKEYQQIILDPPEFAIAKPNDKNILEWHYIITGPPATPYHNGQYYGTLNFPPDYPFKPPSIKMCTPSGRFQCNTRLCLSISDFHPKSWNPSWQVSTILTGLVSFMTSDEMTTGGISTPDQARIGYARESRQRNCENAAFCREFPELVQENKQVIANGQPGLMFGGSRAGKQKPVQSDASRSAESAEGQGSRQSPGLISRYWMTGIGVVVVLVLLSAIFSDA